MIFKYIFKSLEHIAATNEVKENCVFYRFERCLKAKQKGKQTKA